MCLLNGITELNKSILYPWITIELITWWLHFIFMGGEIMITIEKYKLNYWAVYENYILICVTRKFLVPVKSPKN